MNALSTSVLACLIVVVLLTPRRWALLGMAASTLYIIQGNGVEVLGFHLFPVRFLEIAGFARVMARREFSFSKLNGIDHAFIVLYSFTTVVFMLRSTEGQAYQIGLAVDAFLCYFTIRGLGGRIRDLRWFLHAFVIVCVPYLALLLIESKIGHSPFAIINTALGPDILRGDRVRCIGSFRHPSLLGSLGASFLPLYIGLSFSKSKRLYSITGVVFCMAIVGFSNSGGPLAFAAFGVLGWALWVLRDKMRLIRLVGLAAIIATALLMKAPIWYLPTHFSFGGDAWHRSYLIEVAMHHFGEWWLWGMPLSKTTNWFAYALAINGDADITNQFISFGLSSGLMAVVLFIWLLIRAFRSLGRELAAVRLASVRPSETEFILWGLGVMLAGHVANFTAITYFDQFYLIWFMQLAFISNLTHGYGYAHIPSVSIATPVAACRRFLRQHAPARLRRCRQAR